MARLSQSQRDKLDTIIRNLMGTLIEDYKDGFTNDDLLSLVMDNNSNHILPNDTNVRNIIPAIDRLFNTCNSQYNRADGKNYRMIIRNNKHILELCRDFDATNIIKDKNILTFVNGYDANDNLVYDFSQHKFINSEPKDYRLTYNVSCFFEGVPNILEELYSYEWIFNYIDNFSDLYDFFSDAKQDNNLEGIKTCPKGFIKYLDETNKYFSYKTLKEFNLLSKYGAYGVNLLNSLLDSYRQSAAIECLDWMIEEKLLPSITKMLNYSLKAGYIFSRDEVRGLIYYIEEMKKADIEFSIDVNKTVKQNLELAKTARDRQKNEILARQLQKLNFINGFTNNEYIVVVPQNQEEKKDEGSQQHNCVGYYYDGSIMEGENFIFFIRKASNPKKSYITCRYNKRYNEVAEFRGFANRKVTDRNAIAFLKEVEAIIKEHSAEL